MLTIKKRLLLSGAVTMVSLLIALAFFLNMQLRTYSRQQALTEHLALSEKIVNGQGRPRPGISPLTPRGLYDSIADLFTIVAREKGILLEFFHDPLIPEQLVGDATRIRQILLILV